MVERAEDWRFSSALAYTGQAWRFVLTEEVVQLAGGAEALALLMAAKQPKTERELFDPGRPGPRALLGDFGLTQWRRMRRGPWTRKPPEEGIEGVAKESALQAGWNLGALAGHERTRELRLARRKVALELRGRGYRLHQIAEVLGRQEAAISRLILRAQGCAKG